MKIIRVLVVFAIVCAAAGGFADRDDAPFSPVVYPPQRLPLIFSHAKHAARGTTCVQCHPAAPTSRSTLDNLIPTEAVCRGCHAIDRNDPQKAATPVAACTGCHPGFTPGQPVERIYVMPSPLKFDHSAHAKSSCESCHGDLRNIDLATTRQLPTMASCLSCHKDGSDDRRCTTCHFAQVGGLMETKFSHGELAPQHTGLGDDHGPQFAADHKQQARRADATCNACHDRSECVECHQGVVKPADFHQANYIALHSIEAKRGRPDCSACHRAQTFCVGCHERSGIGTRGETDFNSRDPLQQFHPPGWASQGAGPNLHAPVARRSINTCASCHREDDCLTCHSADATGLRISPHPAGWRGSSRCRMLDRGNRRMCLRCHITQDELGCDWSK
ncbi:MAG TPA: cytochrome c3 family protein [Kofleriaceae bacterium]|nr:cytochrome c3 family protein [Kofleriaceae bacterium]